MDQERLSKTGRQLLHYMEFDDEEELLYEIRKDSFGLFMIYLGGFLVTMLFLGMSIAASIFLTGESFESGAADMPMLRPLLISLGLVLALGSIISTLIAAYLYVNNVVLVTSDKIAQFLYPSLFNRKISQLSIGDIQDVTVTQKGILPQMFNYGTLVIESAGEQDNYIFTYTPKPYETSQAIVGAHERNLKLYGN